MDKYRFEQTFRTYLDKHDYSQARLARRLHVARSTVSKWITGENQISYEVMLQLCELFALDPAQRFWRWPATNRRSRLPPRRPHRPNRRPTMPSSTARPVICKNRPTSLAWMMPSLT
jgi:transcriptional regulator with XRE-family HTH domain